MKLSHKEIDLITQEYVKDYKEGVLIYENDGQITIKGIKEISGSYRWLRYKKGLFDRLSTTTELNIVRIWRAGWGISVYLLIYCLGNGTIFLTTFIDLNIFFKQYIGRQKRLVDVPIYLIHFSREEAERALLNLKICNTTTVLSNLVKVVFSLED